MPITFHWIWHFFVRDEKQRWQFLFFHLCLRWLSQLLFTYVNTFVDNVHKLDIHLDTLQLVNDILEFFVLLLFHIDDGHSVRFFRRFFAYTASWKCWARGFLCPYILRVSFGFNLWLWPWHFWFSFLWILFFNFSLLVFCIRLILRLLTRIFVMSSHSFKSSCLKWISSYFCLLPFFHLLFASLAICVMKILMKAKHSVQFGVQINVENDFWPEVLVFAYYIALDRMIVFVSKQINWNTVSFIWNFEDGLALGKLTFETNKFFVFCFLFHLLEVPWKDNLNGRIVQLSLDFVLFFVQLHFQFGYISELSVSECLKWKMTHIRPDHSRPIISGLSFYNGASRWVKCRFLPIIEIRLFQNALMVLMSLFHQHVIKLIPVFILKFVFIILLYPWSTSFWSLHFLRIVNVLFFVIRPFSDSILCCIFLWWTLFQRTRVRTLLVLVFLFSLAFGPEPGFFLIVWIIAAVIVVSIVWILIWVWSVLWLGLALDILHLDTITFVLFAFCAILNRSRFLFLSTSLLLYRLCSRFFGSRLFRLIIRIASIGIWEIKLFLFLVITWLFFGRFLLFGRHFWRFKRSLKVYWIRNLYGKWISVRTEWEIKNGKLIFICMWRVLIFVGDKN